MEPWLFEHLEQTKNAIAMCLDQEASVFNKGTGSVSSPGRLLPSPKQPAPFVQWPSVSRQSYSQ